MGCDKEGMLALQVRVCNRGTNPIASGVNVGFFDGEPSEESLICFTPTSRNLAPGECEIVECLWPDAPVDDPHDVTVIVDFDSERTECIEENNIATIVGVTC